MIDSFMFEFQSLKVWLYPLYSNELGVDVRGGMKEMSKGNYEHDCALKLIIIYITVKTVLFDKLFEPKLIC